jgi:transposase-like protein
MKRRMMGLPRWKFTSEFKLSAVDRLEPDASLAKVARALEVSANVLQRWPQEFPESPVTAFQGAVSGAWSRTGWRN